MSAIDLNSPEVSDQQIKLRSTINTSTKPSNIQPTPISLSSNEFNRVISGMHTTEDATLAQYMALSVILFI